MLVARPQQAGVEPVYIPVMGAEVLFAPIDRAMLRRARRAALRARGDEDAATGPERSASEQIEELGDAFSHALIVEGVRDWRAVGVQRMDGDVPVLVHGEPVFDDLPFTADNLAMVLSDPIAFDAFDDAYVIPFVTAERQIAAPGNGFAASPSGIGEAGTRASGTVTSAAKPKRQGGAGAVRTDCTKPKRTAKKTFGGS
ncbi:MAG: hypothetical protein FJ335_11940 [Sphingomonadales bacterium]|nr:hypothetical protein [Sphingomonadales bacterium]